MSLNELMNIGLPINRKERFYTGTVFPMIVCRNDFQYFGQFLAMLTNYRQQEIDATPNHANIQFFTEYGIKESIYGNSKARFPNPPATKDTPDIIMLIIGEKTQLIALEAKMFLRPSPTSLLRQMQGQYKLLEGLRKPLKIDEIYLYALVPTQWETKLGNFPFPVLTWNTLYKQFIDIHPNDYFLEVLRIALSNFDNLVSSNQTRTGGKAKMSGLQIYTQHQQGVLDMNIMGRNGGFDGKLITEDFEMGTWVHQQYEILSADEPHNSNWFYINDFIARIELLESDQEN